MKTKYVRLVISRAPHNISRVWEVEFYGPVKDGEDMPTKAAPRTSKSKSGKQVLPVNARILQVAGHTGFLALPEGDELIYNAAGRNVMKKNNIPINDLHSVVTKWDGYAEWKKGNDVHFSGAVYSKLAEQVAEKISAQLETPDKTGGLKGLRELSK